MGRKAGHAMLRIIALLTVVTALFLGQSYASAHEFPHARVAHGPVVTSALAQASGDPDCQYDHDGCPCCCAYCGSTVAVMPSRAAGFPLSDRSIRRRPPNEVQWRSTAAGRDPPVPKGLG
jgi:hypothetical protein